MKRYCPFIMEEEFNYKKPCESNLVERNLNSLQIDLINPYRVAKHQRGDVVQLAQEIAMADQFIATNTCGKLELIAKQMNFLKEQATTILKDAKRDINLNHAACNFVKKPGHLYYLYQRESGQQYFSMLSPQEWNGKPPHLFLGGFYLRQDLSWIPEEQMNERNLQYLSVEQLMQNNTLPLTLN